MDSRTIHEFLVEIPISIFMLWLPVRIFRNTWRIPNWRSKPLDDTDIMLYSVFWVIVIYVMQKQQNYRHKIIVTDIMQYRYLILFILFTKDCLKTLSNRYTDFVVLPVELLAVFILARLAFIFHDPVKFSRIVLGVVPTYITLMRVLCERRRAFSYSVFVLSLNGVAFSIVALRLSHIFVVIPNLIGVILGLLVAYTRN